MQAREHGDYDTRSDISMSKVSLLAHSKQEVKFVFNSFSFIKLDLPACISGRAGPIHNHILCILVYLNYDMMKGLMMVLLPVTGMQYALCIPVHASLVIRNNNMYCTRNTEILMSVKSRIYVKGTRMMIELTSKR